MKVESIQQFIVLGLNLYSNMWGKKSLYRVSQTLNTDWKKSPDDLTERRDFSWSISKLSCRIQQLVFVRCVSSTFFTVFHYNALLYSTQFEYIRNACWFSEIRRLLTFAYFFEPSWCIFILHINILEGNRDKPSFCSFLSLK